MTRLTMRSRLFADEALGGGGGGRSRRYRRRRRRFVVPFVVGQFSFDLLATGRRGGRIGGSLRYHDGGGGGSGASASVSEVSSPAPLADKVPTGPASAALAAIPRPTAAKAPAAVVTLTAGVATAPLGKKRGPSLNKRIQKKTTKNRMS